MDDFVESVARFLVSHRGWAGPTIGLLVFLESLAVVGLLVPATTIVIMTGGFLASGLIAPAPVIFWSVVGAVAGDWVSYAVGHRIGPAAYRSWPLNRQRRSVAKARLFFHRFGFVSVFFGRFIGPLRATVPLVAGVMQMDRRTFQAANATSAVLWVLLLLAPGYLAARNLGLGGMDAGDTLLLGAGLASAAFIGAAIVAWLLKPRSPRRRGADEREP